MRIPNIIGVHNKILMSLKNRNENSLLWNNEQEKNNNKYKFFGDSNHWSFSDNYWDINKEMKKYKIKEGECKNLIKDELTKALNKLRNIKNKNYE